MEQGTTAADDLRKVESQSGSQHLAARLSRKFCSLAATRRRDDAGASNWKIALRRFFYWLRRRAINDWAMSLNTFCRLLGVAAS